MQTTYVRDEDKFEIKIELPQKIFDGYVKQAGASGVDELTEQQIIQVLGIAFKDYQKGAISLDGLSAVSNELFNVLKSDFSKELLSILEQAGDLAYQERQEQGSNIQDGLKDIFEYLEKNS